MYSHTGSRTVGVEITYNRWPLCKAYIIGDQCSVNGNRHWIAFQKHKYRRNDVTIKFDLI